MSSSAKAAQKSSIASFLAFNFIVAPICLFIICLALGGLLAWVEGWRVVDGFYFIACDVTGTTSFFTPKHSLSTFGEVMEIVISIVALTASSAVVGLSALMSLSSNLPYKLGIVNSPLRGLFTIFVLIPVIVLIFCIAMGAFMSWIEDWAVKEGFLFLVQTICSINDPLTTVVPASTLTKFIALGVAIAALGITSVIVGLVGAMAICEDTVANIEWGLGKMEFVLCGCGREVDDEDETAKESELTRAAEQEGATRL